MTGVLGLLWETASKDVDVIKKLTVSSSLDLLFCLCVTVGVTELFCGHIVAVDVSVTVVSSTSVAVGWLILLLLQGLSLTVRL